MDPPLSTTTGLGTVDHEEFYHYVPHVHSATLQQFLIADVSPNNPISRVTVAGLSRAIYNVDCKFYWA